MSEKINLELQRLIDRFGRDEADEADEAGQIETDGGEIDAELLQKIADWQRDDEENEPARASASSRAARELDGFLERLLNTPSDL
jgi:hypothetical protein